MTKSHDDKPANLRAQIARESAGRFDSLTPESIADAGPGAMIMGALAKKFEHHFGSMIADLSTKMGLPPAMVANAALAGMGQAMGVSVAMVRSEMPEVADKVEFFGGDLQSLASDCGETVRLNMLAGYQCEVEARVATKDPTPASPRGVNPDSAENPASAPPVTDSAGNVIDLATMRPSGKA
jgi:hypothetical protein